MQAHSRSRHIAARVLSIIGHPVCITPLAALVVMASRGSNLVVPTAVAFVVCAVTVMGYSIQQVRAGKWRHIDASVPTERRSLNYLLVSVFLVAAAIIFQTTGSYPISLGFILGAAITVSAMLLSRRLKLSQHVAFAVYSATFFLPISLWLVAGGICLAAAIGWSRIELRRHSLGEVCVGSVVGVVAGVVLWMFVR